MSEKSNPDTSITMRKPRDNLPLFNLTTAIRKFYSREETQDSFPAIEFESSREDSDAAFLRHYTRYTRLSRFTAALILILATVMLVIVGGVVFWFIERKVVLKNCKDIVQSKQGYTNIRAVNSMTEYVEIIEAYERCSEEKQDTTKIESIMQGIGFAWSIVTTIGYGHHFPHTILGKLLTVVFAIFSIPLYVSVKAELGNYISLFIWKITMHTHRLVGKICKKITPFEAADWEIVLMASFFTVIFLCIFSTLTLLVESWTFGLSVWFTVQTILLIGVGDAEPHNQYFFLYFGVPITVIGDIISSHIIYYLHGRYRICAHMVSRCICGCTEPDSDISKKFMNDRQQKIQLDYNFPMVTTTALPMNVMVCEDNERYNEEALLQHKASMVNQERREMAGKHAHDLTANLPENSLKSISPQAANRRKRALPSFKTSPYSPTEQNEHLLKVSDTNNLETPKNGHFPPKNTL